MHYLHNIPCFSIITAMFASFATTAMGKRSSRALSLIISGLISVASVSLTIHLWLEGESFVYVMGYFPAPWGNELRSGALEAAIASTFSIVTFTSLLGGTFEEAAQLTRRKANLFYVMVDLMLAANLALVYTNDLFTGYVFVEISTISACGLIVANFKDTTLAAGIRYLIMSLMGSGLFLMGVSFLYDITGNLLMESIRRSVDEIAGTGTYNRPLMLAIALILLGLAIKSALWPFHSWLPFAHGYSMVSSSAILSSIVSKGYIFLIAKIIVRVIGLEVVRGSQMLSILFIFGMAAMVICSIEALQQKNLKRMIAYSSIAQFGYIYVGIGIGTIDSVAAAMYQIIAHASAKALLFLAASGLMYVSGSKEIKKVKGAGFLDKAAGVGFTIGALSIIGIPGLAGFSSKFALAKAALDDTAYAVPVLVVLAISTLLNAAYFMRVIIIIFTPKFESEEEKAQIKSLSLAHYKGQGSRLAFYAGLDGLIVLNLVMGICQEPVMDMLKTGLGMFG